MTILRAAGAIALAALWVVVVIVAGVALAIRAGVYTLAGVR